MLGAVYTDDRERLTNESSPIYSEERSSEDSFPSLPSFGTGLSLQQRVAVVLRYVWDFKNEEIGHCLGVSESRISQILTAVQKDLRKTLSKASPKTPGQQEERSSELGSLLQEENGLIQRMEQSQNRQMAKAESQSLEDHYEQGYSEWLT